MKILPYFIYCITEVYFVYTGGKKGGYYHDDIWNIKYLPKFLWSHLSEKIGKLASYCTCMVRCSLFCNSIS